MEFTAQQIADFLKGEIIGDPYVKVNNLSKIEEGLPGTLTFLANPKYSHFLYTTQASIILINNDFTPEQEINATLIRVENAYASLARLLNLVAQSRPPKKGQDKNCAVAASARVPESAYVGAYAVIGENTVIGENVQIYPHVCIGDNVTVGNNTILYAGVKVYDDCLIGNDCILHAGAVIGADGFGFAPQGDDYMKIPQIGNVILEDNVEIGANTTVDRATMGSTVIRKGVKLDNLIQIAHNVEIGNNTVMAAQCGIAGSTRIGKNCMFAGQVGIAGHITIGDNVQLGAQAGIPNHVEANARLMGTPAVPARDFARSTVIIKRLPDMEKTMREMQREIQEIKVKQK